MSPADAGGSSGAREREGAAPSLELPAKIAALWSEEERSFLVALRRDLHRHPELSFEEHNTCARLEAALETLAPTAIERVAGTGLVVRFAGLDRDLPPVAVRGDIDALPIEEDTGLPYSSENPGVMHACGHDVHATWAVAAGRLISRQPAAGDVLIVLQPAEEVGKGAAKVLESGALDGCAAIYGAHVDRRFAVGEAVVQPGPMAAAADQFEILIRGQGGHGARPHLAHDPIVAASALVQALQTVASRRADPGLPVVLTVGSFRAGVAANVIPEEARLTGTMRSTDPTSRKLLEEELRHLVGHIAAAHRVRAELDLEPGTPPIINTQPQSEWARAVAVDLLGEAGVVPMPGVNMGGEDFSVYLEAIPGAFFRVGAREAAAPDIGAHTPRFYAAEGAIFVGGALLAGAARKASQALLDET